jgi:type I restriction enzyme S subunit
MANRLPKGWEEKELGELVEKISNGTTTKQNKDSRGLQVTRIETISNGVIDTDRCGYIDVPIKDVENFKLKQGDILFSHINSVEHLAKTAIYNNYPETLVHGMNLLVIRANQKIILPKYLFFLFRSPSVRDYYRKICKRAVNQASIPIASVKTLTVPIPPLSSQQKIVAILEKAEAIKQKRQKIEELTNRVLQSIFVDMFGDPETNPNGWKIDFIRDHVNKTETRDPKRKPETRFLYVDIAGVDNKSKTIVNSTEMLGSEAPSRARKVIHTGDIIVSTVRPNLNAVSRIPDSLDQQICSTGFCVLNCNKTLNSRYLFEITKTKYFVSNLVSKATGASYPAVSDNIILNVEIPVPPIELQKSFSQIVEKFESARQKQLESKKYSQELFNSLMQKAFSGELG